MSRYAVGSLVVLGVVVLGLLVPRLAPTAGGRDATLFPPPAGAPPGLDLDAPRVVPRGTAIPLRVSTVEPLPPGSVLMVDLALSDGRGRIVARTTAQLDSETASVAASLPASRAGIHWAVLTSGRPGGGRALASVPVRVIPGYLSLAPPLLAIGLALLLRSVVPALLAGVWLGAYLVEDYRLLGSFLRTLDRYLAGELSDGDHVKIILFSLLLGGMVGIMSRAGGTQGIVERLKGAATSARRGQLATWAMGLFVFFDDYANTLVVGNTMRPLTDRLGISREKLAFIVDSTAAPVACFALISTWIGFEVGLIGDALQDLGIQRDPYTVFLGSIPYLFYPLLALGFVAMVALARRDFGPMAAAEVRAARGDLLRPGAVPLADWSEGRLEPAPGIPLRARNALLPIALVVGTTFAGLWLTGRSALADAGAPEGTAPAAQVLLSLRDLGTIFGKADAFNSLLWAAGAGCLAALALGCAQRLFRLEEGLQAWLGGMKAMLLAVVILSLAWAVSRVCGDLGTAGYLSQLVSGMLNPRLLPLVIFAVAAGVAFATGSSWTTMGILFPLAVPLAHQLATGSGLEAGPREAILLGSVASVLAGSIFGDHCSPISDTTVMSSMASACDHVDHVRTQLPYALVVAAVSMALGNLPTAFGLPPLAALGLGFLALAVILWLVGRPLPGSTTAS